MELLANIVDCIHPLTIFAKYSILGVPGKTKEKLCPLAFLSQKIRGLQSLQISSTFKFDFIFKLLPYDETLLIANAIHVSLISN